MIKLLDLIPIPEEEYVNWKIHFASHSEKIHDPLMALLNGTFKKWQEYQKWKDLERKYVLSLIMIGKDEWIFGGLYSMHGREWRGNHYEYDTKLLPVQNDLIKRLIIQADYKTVSRRRIRNMEGVIDNLYVSQILKNPYSRESFSGYNKVRLHFNTLKNIINENDVSWETALSSMKGVYLITDMTNGKLYVGSASGEDSFWSRWSQYVKDGHGGNKKLKNIIREHGIEYAVNYQFSILEVSSDPDIAKKREQYWKKVFRSIKYGYNDN